MFGVTFWVFNTGTPSLIFRSLYCGGRGGQVGKKYQAVMDAVMKPAGGSDGGTFFGDALKASQLRCGPCRGGAGTSNNPLFRSCEHPP